MDAWYGACGIITSHNKFVKWWRARKDGNKGRERERLEQRGPECKMGTRACQCHPALKYKELWLSPSLRACFPPSRSYQILHAPPFPYNSARRVESDNTRQRCHQDVVSRDSDKNFDADCFATRYRARQAGRQDTELSKAPVPGI